MLFSCPFSCMSCPPSGGLAHRRLGKRTREELVDRAPALVTQRPRTGAGEVRMGDAWHRRAARRRPCRTAPLEPVIAILIEHPERLVTELGELGAPARAAADGIVVLD